MLADSQAELLRRWIETHHKPFDTVVYLGIDWTEIHRFERARDYWGAWNVRAPLCEKPYLSKAEMLRLLEQIGIKPPRLYEMGFAHNNCGGFCVKAGQAHFRLLLEKMPERYAYHERKEQELRVSLGKDVAILRCRTGGGTKPLTLKELRERITKRTRITGEWGGCGCVV